MSLTVVELATLLGVLGALIGIAKIIWSGGKTEQNFRDKLVELERQRLEDNERMNKALVQLDEHIKKPDIHVNPVTEAREYENQKDWRKSIESKLDLLLRNK